MLSYSSFKIFSIVFGIFYAAVFFSLWAPFRYYPQTGTFHLDVQGPDAGPPILWYGWVTSAFVASAVVALIVPRRFADRLPPAFSWLVPLITILVIFIHERHWFQ
jgi:hypothetical protein